MCNKGLVTAASLFLIASSNLFAVEVGSIADSRFAESGGWTLDGDEMTDTRAKLLNQANFGPGGAYPEAIHITDVAGPITYTALSPFDVFFVGYLSDDDDDFITEAEGAAMHEWVSDGGTMVISCDDFDHDAICIAFALSISGTDATPPANPTFTGATRPPFDGPFGTPSELAMAGNNPYFDDTGGFAVLAEDQGGNPVILEALIGDGRVVALSDVDMISNDTLSDGAEIVNDNDQFLGNLIAYLADSAVETFFINPGLNGNWWGGPGRSGEGAQLEVVVDGEVYVVVMTFYSYNTSGDQIFLIAVGGIDGNASALDVFITEGGMWGDDFDPGMVDETPFGNAVFTASSCGAAHLIVTPNAEYMNQGFGVVEYDLSRLAQPAGPCPIEF